MAHLWVETEDGSWAVRPITEGVIALSQKGPLAAAVDAESTQHAVFICQAGGPTGEWVLMAGCRPHAYVNGSALVLGIRVINDRDEITIRDTQSPAGTRCFFSTETLAEVQPLPEFDEPVHCPRCRQLIEPNSPAVRCPNPACKLWHHQRDDLPCWNYNDRCASPVCGEPTRLQDFRWSPEGL